MIWCDLDNTLIWTWTPLITSPLLSVLYGLPMELKPPSGRGRRRLRRIVVPGLGTGRVCARKSAGPFLAALRELSEVRMMTAAKRVYAEAMNDAFAFGFTSAQIVAREELARPPKDGIDPHGILIDNASEFSSFDQEQHSQQSAKRWYLGRFTNLVEVPFFHGEVKDSFDENWRDYVIEIERVMNRPKKAMDPSEWSKPVPNLVTPKSTISPIALLRAAQRVGKKRGKR